MPRKEMPGFFCDSQGLSLMETVHMYGKAAINNEKRLFGLCILLLTVCAGSAFAEPATVTGSAPGMESVITATITIQRIFCVSKHSMKITKIPVNSAVEAARDNTSHIHTENSCFFLPAIWNISFCTNQPSAALCKFSEGCCSLSIDCNGVQREQYKN